MVLNGIIVMRIIAGKSKGQKIVAPTGRAVRPTTDRVREALFSCIGFGIDGARVLDLFAGSGALGLESLSRGAVEVVFVEKHRQTANILVRNINSCGVRTASRLLRGDAIRILSQLAEHGEKFDLIFLDPPYGTSLLEKALSFLSQNDLLTSHGVIWAEHPRDTALPGFVNLQETLVKRYGAIELTALTRAVHEGSQEES